MIAAVAIVALAPTPAAAQPLPRTPDGKPNLSGIWQAVNSAAWNILPHAADADVPAGLGVVDGNGLPYTPPAAARQRDNYANRAKLDPETKCWLPGVPRATYMGFPFQIVQTPIQVSILYEYAHAVRNIFMNSPHPKGPIEFWMGDSRGTWDGDTLVVDVVHFNDQTWFDKAGNHHSELLHVVERYTLMGPNHIGYEVTIEDPNVFTRPWKMSMPLYRRLDRNMQILDYECSAFDEAFRTGPAEQR
ncbi:MAG: hypothetical protein EXQ53_08400 [Acidobacteria bacterium]|nr:hypothetical protein [Acidobacteriota bacterium]